MNEPTDTPDPLHLQRCVIPVGPLPHRGVVVLGCLVVAHQLQDEHAVRRTDAALSIGVNILVGGDPVVRQQLADFGGRAEAVGLAVHHTEPL